MAGASILSEMKNAILALVMSFNSTNLQGFLVSYKDFL